MLSLLSHYGNPSSVFTSTTPSHTHSHSEATDFILPFAGVSQCRTNPTLEKVITTQPTLTRTVILPFEEASSNKKTAEKNEAGCLYFLKNSAWVNTLTKVYRDSCQAVTTQLLQDIGNFLEAMLVEMRQEVILAMAEKLSITPAVAHELVKNYAALVSVDDARKRQGGNRAVNTCDNAGTSEPWQAASLNETDKDEDYATAYKAFSTSLQKCKIENKQIFAAMIRETCSPKSRVALLHAGYGLPIMKVGYVRAAVQLRLALPSEVILENLLHKPEKLSPDIYLNLETGATAGFSTKDVLEHPGLFEAGVGLGVLARTRTGASLVFQCNKSKGHYDFQGLKYTHEQLLRARINVSAMMSPAQTWGIQASDYVTYSSKTTYPQSEWTTFAKNIVLSAMGGAITGVGASLFLPPTIENTSAAAVAGTFLGGYVLGKTSLGEKFTRSSFEMINAGATAGALGQTGWNGGVAARASAKNTLFAAGPDNERKMTENNKKSTASVETVLRYRSALPSPGAL